MIRAFLAGLGYAVASGFILAFALLVATPVDAKGLHPRCNIDWPCAVPQSRAIISSPSLEGAKIIVSKREARRIARGQRMEERSPIVSARGNVSIRSYINGATILPHPPGCPRRAFCGCGAAVEVFVIKQVLGDGKVLAYDANSGGRRTRLHVRSLAGFAVVNPHG